MRAPLPLETVFSVRLSTWRLLFDACGSPPGLDPKRFTLASVATAAASADLPTPLARAHFAIAAFSTEAGRTDIYSAADALSFPTRWPDATSPADLCALLLAYAPTDPAVAELLTAAFIFRNRAFRPISTHLFVGTRGRDEAVGEPTQYAAGWRRLFGKLAARRDLGAVVAVNARAIGGRLIWEIVHEDRIATRVTASPKKGDDPAPAPSTFRPLRSHRVVYTPASKRLEITTDAPELVIPLAETAGALFFGDARHFLGEPAVELWALQERGPGALAVAALAPRIKETTAVGGNWNSGEGHAVTPRGKDFFDALARYNIRIEGGRLDQITLRAELHATDGAPASCDVSLRPPFHATVSEPEVEPLIHELLDRAKITSPEPRVLDFFSHQPWIDPAPLWIERLGKAAFDALVAAEILVADHSNREVAPPGRPDAARTAIAYPLGGTRCLAWSPDPTVAPFVVEERDLVVYALAFRKLAKRVAKEVGLASPAVAPDDDGVLYCGTRTLGPTHVLVYLLTRPIRATTADRLRDSAAHGHAILIAPEGREIPSTLHRLAMPALGESWEPLVGAIVRKLRLESFVDTPAYAPAGSRIVLHRATERVWFDGVLCKKLQTRHFRLLEILIVRAGAPLHTKEIADFIAQGQGNDDTTRKAIESLAPAVRKSFRAAKKKAPKWIDDLIDQPKHGYYTLRVPGFVD